MANNLKDYGTYIPGSRPGKRTAEYLERVMLRITYLGAAFLAVIAIIPSVISTSLEADYRVASFYGGTALSLPLQTALSPPLKSKSHQGLTHTPVPDENKRGTRDY